MEIRRHCLRCGQEFTIALVYGRRELGRKRIYCGGSCRAMASKVRHHAIPPDYSPALIDLLFRRAQARQRYERALGA